MDDGWHQQASVRELLVGYAETLAELRRRGVTRTNNAPLGDYAEWLLATALDAEIAESTSAKSWDLALPDGRLVQVKARLVADPPTAGQLQTSPFRSWEFDLAALLLFDAATYVPTLAVLAPVGVVQSACEDPDRHVNGAVAFIRAAVDDRSEASRTSPR
ncbi:MAG: hypothetical protein U5K30_05765 [Acidimicrobiales bacterium]|nr:hypothetical protein [Acidimicrobiales bacterium]